MSINGYFGVRSLETIVNGLKNMDTKAECCLFLAIGLGAYGYFKYGKDGEKNGKRKETQNQK